MRLPERHPLVIVGGGPAGAAAAAFLARDGRKPLLIERSTGPQHKICGEFVSVEAKTDLDELGVDLLALGAAPIRTVRVASGGALAQAPLPFTGMGLSRRRLDEALLARAEVLGAQILRGVTAREVAFEGGRLALRLRGGEIQADTVLLATGKHDLHAPRRPAADNGLIGFKTYFALQPDQAAELAGAVEVALFPGGYAGLQMVEDGMANLCLLAQAELFERAGKSWGGLLDALTMQNPHLRRRLDGATDLLDKPLTIAQVPYGFVHRDRGGGDPPNLYRLGDQMGVIPSFCGDGMAIALHSARLAATALGARDTAPAYHERMRADVGGQIRLAQNLYGFAQAPLARRGMMAAFRLFPALMAAVARWTRIPAASIKAG